MHVQIAYADSISMLESTLSIAEIENNSERSVSSRLEGRKPVAAQITVSQKRQEN